MRFEDFVKELESVRNALRVSERVATGSTNTVEFRVVNLSRSSPTSVTLEARPCAKTDNTKLVVDTFVESLDAIQSRGDLPHGFDGRGLKAFQSMTSMLGKQVSAVVIQRNGTSIGLSEALSRNVEAILGHKEYTQGSISGKLEKINLHRSENVFSIYPIIGPDKGVRCRFGSTLEPAAVLAVNKYVDVFGRLEYNAVDAFPQEVEVAKIEIHPDVPTVKLMDLRGIAPNATGDKSSEDFIGELREEWG